jgi:hypothetical protein
MMPFMEMKNFLLVLLIVNTNAFISKAPLTARKASICMTNDNTVVIGVAGGVAETVACRLLDSDGKGLISAVFDRKPFSPQLLEAIQAKRVQIYSTDIDDKDKVLDIYDERIKTFDEVLNGKVVIAINDEGDNALRGGEEKNSKGESGILLTRLLKNLKPTVKSIVCATSAESDKSGGGFLGFMGGAKGSEQFRTWCTENNKPFSLFRYGQLTGGVPGAEPLPFIGLPLLEPELHPSYVLRSVVLTSPSSNQYAAAEICTRAALGEAIARQTDRDGVIETLIVSIAGTPLTDNEWDLSFTRMTAKSNVELCRINFGAINKPAALTNWLGDVWFPQALIEADAATILTGARPVRAIKNLETGSVQIRWEDLLPDLTVSPAGGLEIRLIQGEKPAISVIRLSDASLPGEMQLMDRLVEGVNKNVYKRQICTPTEGKTKAAK